MRIYKYHIRLYTRYKKYGIQPFCTKEAGEVMNVLTLQVLHKKGFIRRFGEKKYVEKIREDVKDWKNGNWMFWALTNDGIKICRYLEEHSDEMAKVLLNGR